MPHDIDDHSHNIFSFDRDGRHLKIAFAGGTASCVGRFLTQPLDVVKIRFQLQVEPIKHRALHASKYVSIIQAIKTISKEEGIRAFWKGHTPAQALSIIYGVAQFWGYEQLKAQSKFLHVYSGHQRLSDFVCGGIAGGCATMLTIPLDVVRTRLIAQDNGRGYTNSYRAIVTICKNEGIYGCYRGCAPALLQVVPLTGINFMFYGFFNEKVVKLLGLHTKSELPAIATLISGASAGIIAKTVVYPLDLAKKRLQIQGFGEFRQSFGTHFKCTGVISALRQTVKLEGFLGLYKGMWPSVWKACLTSAINFCVYDEIRHLIIRSTDDDDD